MRACQWKATERLTRPLSLVRLQRFPWSAQRLEAHSPKAGALTKLRYAPEIEACHLGRRGTHDRCWENKMAGPGRRPRLGARGRHPHFVRLARSLAPNLGFWPDRGLARSPPPTARRGLRAIGPAAPARVAVGGYALIGSTPAGGSLLLRSYPSTRMAGPCRPPL